LLQARESDNPEQAEIHDFLMLDIERRVYDLNNINDRLQALNRPACIRLILRYQRRQYRA
ncbi:hypothetical protein MJI65_24390, partial [Salmonella enterica subsp. enterica serovar Anatum]|nr:hypothetical protein [Salmonella enterica subsp. enterica serovar Anatum]